MATQLKHDAHGVLRWGVGSFFVLAGAAKLAALPTTTAIVASRGLPAPGFVAVSVGVFELLGGVLLLADQGTRPVATALAAFAAMSVALFHFSLVMVGPKALDLALDVAILTALLTLAIDRLPASLMGPGGRRH